MPTVLKKPTILPKIVGFLKIVAEMEQLVRTRSQKINYDVFGEKDSYLLSNSLQTHIFWKFDHISRIYNQINYRNIWFPKVIIILIMTAQVLFSMSFSKKDPHLNVVGPLLRGSDPPAFVFFPTQPCSQLVFMIYILDIIKQHRTNLFSRESNILFGIPQ